MTIFAPVKTLKLNYKYLKHHQDNSNEQTSGIWMNTR